MKIGPLSNLIVILIATIVLGLVGAAAFYLMNTYNSLWYLLLNVVAAIPFYVWGNRMEAKIAGSIFQRKMAKTEFAPGKCIVSVFSGLEKGCAEYKLKKNVANLEFDFFKFAPIPELCMAIYLKYDDREEEILYFFTSEMPYEMWAESDDKRYRFNFLAEGKIRANLVLKTPSGVKYEIAGKKLFMEGFS